MAAVTLWLRGVCGAGAGARSHGDRRGRAFVEVAVRRPGERASERRMISAGYETGLDSAPAMPHLMATLLCAGGSHACPHSAIVSVSVLIG
jgi:hypothetical protein